MATCQKRGGESLSARRYDTRSETQTHPDLGTTIQRAAAMTIIEISRRLTQAHVAIHTGGEGVARPHANFIAIVEITTGDCIGRIEGVAAYRNRRRLRQIDVAIATQTQAATITVVGIVLGPACPDANILRTAVLHTQQLGVVNCRIFAVIAVDNTATQGNTVGNLTCRLKLHGICAKVEVQAVGGLCAHGKQQRTAGYRRSDHMTEMDFHCATPCPDKSHTPPTP